MSEGEKPAPAYRLWQRVTQEQQVRGLNLGELAALAGVHRNSIPRLRTNKTPPLTKTVSNLAKVLDIPVREAFELAGLDPNSAPTEKAETGSELAVEDPYAQLEELLAQIPESRRKKLKEVHIRERERYQRKLAEARADYERTLSDLEEIIREVIHPGADDDPDPEP